jgi:tetratricopeptide (TPR) repeat protein
MPTTIPEQFYLSQPDSPVRDFTQAIALKPDDAFAYRMRGMLYSWKQDFDDAIADFNKAIALKPEDVDGYDGRALVWYMKQDYDKAWADVKRCRALGATPDPDFIQHLQQASGRKE